MVVIQNLHKIQKISQKIKASCNVLSECLDIILERKGDEKDEAAGKANNTTTLMTLK